MIGFLERLMPPVRTRRARYGITSYYARDVWHGRAFRLYGEWSESEVALWRKIVRPGDVVLDVGAHVGAHAMALASLVGPAGRVHAFEPQAGALELLKRNVAQNGLRNVMVHGCGLGDGRAGLMRYDRPDYRRTGNFGAVELRPVVGGDQGPVARMVALDSLGLEPSFVKIDVEGMELDVLSGAVGTVLFCRPVLYVENDRAAKSAALVRHLEGLGYDLWWHPAPLFNPCNFDGRRQNVFGGVVSLNMLALPRRRRFDDPSLVPLQRVAS